LSDQRERQNQKGKPIFTTETRRHGKEREWVSILAIPAILAMLAINFLIRVTHVHP
jgi:hypothetical protein